MIEDYDLHEDCDRQCTSGWLEQNSRYDIVYHRVVCLSSRVLRGRPLQLHLDSGSLTVPALHRWVKFGFSSMSNSAHLASGDLESWGAALHSTAETSLPSRTPEAYVEVVFVSREHVRQAPLPGVVNHRCP